MLPENLRGKAKYMALDTPGRADNFVDAMKSEQLTPINLEKKIF
jgi:hypothetical protein